MAKGIRNYCAYCHEHGARRHLGGLLAHGRCIPKEVRQAQRDNPPEDPAARAARLAAFIPRFRSQHAPGAPWPYALAPA
jgi:hypothetical protein